MVRLSLIASGEHMSIMARGRRDISDSVWEKPDPRLPGREGSRGGGARDNRRFVNVVGLCAGAPWRDPPPAPGGWSDTRRRFIRWRDNGVRERPPEIPIDEPDPAWLMIDVGHCGVHPHAAGAARGGNRDMIRTKGSSTQNRIWPRMRMACRSGLLSHGARQRIALGQSLRLTDLQQKDFWRTRATTGMGFSPGPKGGWKRPFLLRKTARGGVIATGSLAGPGTR